jgi:hypothetical protein
MTIEIEIPNHLIRELESRNVDPRFYKPILEDFISHCVGLNYGVELYEFTLFLESGVLDEFTVETNDFEMWRLIEAAQWKSDHSYKRIRSEWSKLPEDKFQELKEFIHSKASELGRKYENAWLGKDGGPGIDVSDDGWSDLRYDVVGRGEEFYNTITVEKLREMADNYDYQESFSYCTLK